MNKLAADFTASACPAGVREIERQRNGSEAIMKFSLRPGAPNGQALAARPRHGTGAASSAGDTADGPVPASREAPSLKRKTTIRPAAIARIATYSQICGAGFGYILNGSWN